jgi:hypothetical protein
MGIDMIRRGAPIRARDVGALPQQTRDSIMLGGTGGQRLGDDSSLILNPAKARTNNLHLMGVVDLSADGDYLECVVYDPVTTTFGENVVYVVKPAILAASQWNGVTQTTLDTGTEYTYDATDLDITYQRRATWYVYNEETEEDDEFTETQEITASYYYHELIVACRTAEGILLDTNQAGRHWAAV